VALRHPRTARLLRPADFAALRTNSQRVSTRHFTAQYRHALRATARLGMAVSRKVSKNAVVRNRIRRQIRESFRMQRAQLPNVDVLVIARVSAAGPAKPVLREELNVLWQRLIAAGVATTLNTAEATGTMRAS
jgi:ribonuclease P protein component